MISNKAKIILTLFAYLPLFFVITVRNLRYVQNMFYNYLGIEVTLSVIFIVVVILSVILFFIFVALVKKILTKVESISPRDIDVEIKSEKNTEMLGFLLTYIVPFCITFENGLYDLFAFFILFVLILYVYVDTSLFCINPLLKCCFGYNIYEIEMNERTNFLLTKKKHRNKTKNIFIYRITEDLYKEK